MQPNSPQTRLLRALSPADLRLLQPHLQPVSLGLRDVIVSANQPIAQVYFLEAGLGSIVARTAEGRRIEVGLFGREGMSATQIVLGGDRTPYDSIVQAEGTALRMGTAA